MFKFKQAQAFAEFVLVSIPFLILMMGVLQFAHIAVVKIIVNHAAFTTARGVSIHSQYPMLTQVAQDSIPFKDKHNISVAISSENNNEDIKIVLIYKMQLIFPFANKIIKEVKKLDDYYLPIRAEFLLPKETYLS